MVAPNGVVRGLDPKCQELETCVRREVAKGSIKMSRMNLMQDIQDFARQIDLGDLDSIPPYIVHVHSCCDGATENDTHQVKTGA